MTKGMMNTTTCARVISLKSVDAREVDSIQHEVESRFLILLYYYGTGNLCPLTFFFYQTLRHQCTQSVRRVFVDLL